tara:strand:+ start:8511 stop:9269 length:759 start_codon:yes stop_codon:yes gene_type:complete
MPINKSYTAIQRAVVECAYAGCETIWITVGPEQVPLLREILGDYVEDPVWYYRKKSRFPKENKKQIPIFYVPIHPKDMGRRDCQAWGILNSAMAAYYTAKKISNWLVPNKYYVAPVYGVYEPSILQEHRQLISSHGGAFYLTHEGKSVAKGKRLGFTFDTDSFVRVRKQFRDLEKSRKRDAPRPARFFQMEEVFNVIDPEYVESPTMAEVPKYSDISFWNGYIDYMAHPYVEMPQIKILKNGKKTFALPPIV